MHTATTYRRSQPFAAWSHRQHTARQRRAARESTRPRFNSQPIATQIALTGTAPAVAAAPETQPVPVEIAAAPAPAPERNPADPNPVAETLLHQVTQIIRDPLAAITSVAAGHEPSHIQDARDEDALIEAQQAQMDAEAASLFRKLASLLNGRKIADVGPETRALIDPLLIDLGVNIAAQ